MLTVLVCESGVAACNKNNERGLAENFEAKKTSSSQYTQLTCIHSDIFTHKLMHNYTYGHTIATSSSLIAVDNLLLTELLDGGGLLLQERHALHLLGGRESPAAGIA